MKQIHLLRCVGLSVFVLLLMSAALPALAAQPVAAVDSAALAALEYDQWFLDTIDGQPSGYSHEWLTILDDGTIETGYESRRVETHGGDLMISDRKTVWLETAELEAISVMSQSAAGTQIVRQTYTVHADRVELVSEQGGRTTTRTLPAVQGDWLTPTALELAWKQHVASGDDAFALATWDPELGARPVMLSYTREEAEHVELPSGEVVEVTRWKVNYSALPGLDLFELYDEAGAMQSQRYAFSDQAFASLLTDESVVDLEFDPPEMLGQSLVRPNVPIERPSRVRRAVFDLKFSDAAPEDLLPPTTLHQRAERLADGTVRLVVDMDTDNALAQGDLPGTDPSYMDASIMIDHTDEEIQKLAAQVRRRVGGGVDDMRFARSARRFVTRYMTGINLATGSATASEVARTRSGDCTECAVLLAAILRAQGIPSRCATGLAYSDTEFGGESDIFVYHMWTQAWIEDDSEQGGHWVDFDSAMFRYTATHITLGMSAMDDANSGVEMIQMIPMMNGLEIEVVEVGR